MESVMSGREEKDATNIKSRINEKRVECTSVRKKLTQKLEIEAKQLDAEESIKLKILKERARKSRRRVGPWKKYLKELQRLYQRELGSGDNFDDVDNETIHGLQWGEEKEGKEMTNRLTGLLSQLKE
jgi:hypothetical protein